MIKIFMLSVLVSFVYLCVEYDACKRNVESEKCSRMEIQVIHIANETKQNENQMNPRGARIKMKTNENPS